MNVKSSWTPGPSRHSGAVLRGSQRRLGRLFVPIVATTLGASCIGYHDVPDPPEPQLPRVKIHLDQKFQTMAGFGASSAWTAPTMSADMADFFFSEEKGIGLSLLRVQIKPWGETTELGTVDLAVERGVAVWGAPWSPPAEWKDTNSTVEGGYLLPQHYQDWADRLANFADAMDARGTPMFAISAQNEPDYVNHWDTCQWEEHDFADFIFDNLVPALQERDLSTKILAPESQNWGRLAEFADPILDREEAADHIYALAAHAYDHSPIDYTRGREAGFQIWQTEVSDPEDAPGDRSINSGLRVANEMFNDISVAQVSAWHYWWLLPPGEADESTESNGALFNGAYEPTYRAYAMGHFSKFVRPGFERIGTSDPSRTLVKTLAFKSDKQERLVIVALNEGDTPLTVDVALPDGSQAKEAQFWLSDAEHQLERVTSIAVQDEPTADAAAEDPITTPYFTVELRKRSIATFVLDEAGNDSATGGNQGSSGDGDGDASSGDGDGDTMSGDGDESAGGGGQGGADGGLAGATMSDP